MTVTLRVPVPCLVLACVWAIGCGDDVTAAGGAGGTGGSVTASLSASSQSGSDAGAGGCGGSLPFDPGCPAASDLVWKQVIEGSACSGELTCGYATFTPCEPGKVGAMICSCTADGWRCHPEDLGNPSCPESASFVTGPCSAAGELCYYESANCECFFDGMWACK